MSLLREPLIQFFLLGGLLFLAAQTIHEHRRQQDHEIVIDRALTDRLAYLYEKQMGKAPDSEQLDALIEEHIRLEVLSREARHLDLDRDDEIIRRRLAQKLDFLLRDTLIVDEPDDEALAAYYREHVRAFHEPVTASFTHLYFNPESGDGSSALKRAQRVLDELHHGATESSSLRGDRFPLQDQYTNVTFDRAQQLFGHTRFAEALFQVGVHEWAGPFESGYGWHLVYINNRNEPTPQDLQTIKDRVRAAYLSDEREAENAKRFAEIKAKYLIRRIDAKGAR